MFAFRPPLIQAVVVLVLSAALLLAFRAQAAGAVPPINMVAVDTDTSGNTATSLGTIQACSSLAFGATLDIDVAIDSVPSVDTVTKSGGVAGFAFNLTFNPSVLKVTAVNDSFLIEAAGGVLRFEMIDANVYGGTNADPLPATTGNLRVDFANLGPNPTSGAGVLSRISLQAVGSGISVLTLSNVEVLDANTNSYTVTNVNGGAVSGGGPCQGPPPQEPVDVLAIDADPTSNAPRTVGQVDSCISVATGETFQSDIVVPGAGVPAADGISGYAFNLRLGDRWGTRILEVKEQNIQMLLAQAPGSEVEPTGSDALPPVPNAASYLAAAHDAGSPARIEPAGTSETGPGVLARFTLKALSPGFAELSLGGPGVTIVAPQQPVLIDTFGRVMTIADVQPAMIAVDNLCPSVEGVGTIHLTTTPAGFHVECSGSITITATVKDTKGGVFAGETVTFSLAKGSADTNFGGKRSESRKTDSNGQSSVTMSAGNRPGQVAIFASAGFPDRTSNPTIITIAGGQCASGPTPVGKATATPGVTPTSAETGNAEPGLIPTPSSEQTPAALPKAGGADPSLPEPAPLLAMMAVAVCLALGGAVVILARRRGSG